MSTEIKGEHTEAAGLLHTIIADVVAGEQDVHTATIVFTQLLGARFFLHLLDGQTAGEFCTGSIAFETSAQTFADILVWQEGGSRDGLHEVRLPFDNGTPLFVITQIATGRSVLMEPIVFS